MIYQHDQQSNQQYDNIHRHIGGHYKLRHWIWLPMPLKFKHMRSLDMTDVDVKGTFGYRTTKWYQWAHTTAIYWLNPWNKKWATWITITMKNKSMCENIYSSCVINIYIYINMYTLLIGIIWYDIIWYDMIWYDIYMHACLSPTNSGERTW